MRNTTLDDISAVIGFTATLRVSAWFGERGTLYVPTVAEKDQLLVRLLGISAAKRLSENWPGENLSIPRPAQYESDFQARQVVDLLTGGMGPRRISHFLRLSDRRVQQIIRELEVNGLIEPIAGKTVDGEPVMQRTRWKAVTEKAPGKTPLKKPVGKAPTKSRLQKEGVGSA